MMEVIWSINKQTMIVKADKKWSLQVSSTVRNELNGWRPNPDKKPAAEVVHMITSNNVESQIAVMPRHFPLGKWRITGLDFRSNPDRAPLIIITNAWQQLEVWTTKEDGGYDKPTGKMVNDFQYYIHCSKYNTTQGCGKAHELNDLYRFASEVGIYLLKQDIITLEVTI